MGSRTAKLLLIAVGSALTVVVVVVVLALLAPSASARPPRDGCGAHPPDTRAEHLVFDVAVADPDGGLVMRSGPGVHSPRVGVLAPTAGKVWPTGQCWNSPTGSAWYQVWTDASGPSVWVSSNFLRPTVPACVLETQRSVPSLSPLNTGLLITRGLGRAVRDGDQIAFMNASSDAYQMLPAEAAVLGSRICAPIVNRHPHAAATSFDLPPPLPSHDGHPYGLVACG